MMQIQYACEIFKNLIKWKNRSNLTIKINKQCQTEHKCIYFKFENNMLKFSPMKAPTIIDFYQGNLNVGYIRIVFTLLVISL